jgi:hypothetical protein
LQGHEMVANPADFTRRTSEPTYALLTGLMALNP